MKALLQAAPSGKIGWRRREVSGKAPLDSRRSARHNDGSHTLPVPYMRPTDPPVTLAAILMQTDAVLRDLRVLLLELEAQEREAADRVPPCPPKPNR
jgi:hypothetical protein